MSDNLSILPSVAEVELARAAILIGIVTFAKSRSLDVECDEWPELSNSRAIMSGQELGTREVRVARMLWMERSINNKFTKIISGTHRIGLELSNLEEIRNFLLN